MHPRPLRPIATHRSREQRSSLGHVLKFAMSLTEPANRDAFKSDERGYMKKFQLTEAEMGLIERRHWSGLIAAGGNIYLLLKIAGAVGQNLLEMGAQMRGETLDAFLHTRPGMTGAAEAGADKTGPGKTDPGKNGIANAGEPERSL
jgi:protocatechuate 4,5-dioxygenase, alpha chain